MRTVWILLGLVWLGACSSAPKPETTAARSICAAGYNDPALDPIRDKIMFEDDAASKASMTYLADSRRPNAVERGALQHLDAANRRCWDAWERAGSSPSINQARTEVSTALAQLYQGELTFGDFNRQRAAALTRMYAALRDEENRQSYDPYGRYDDNQRLFPGFGFGFGIIR
jgi:hypothetical protein